MRPDKKTQTNIQMFLCTDAFLQLKLLSGLTYLLYELESDGQLIDQMICDRFTCKIELITNQFPVTSSGSMLCNVIPG